MSKLSAKPKKAHNDNAKVAATKTAVKAKAKDSNGFSVGESVVYPTHGVGVINAIESQEIGGIKLDVYVIYFDKDKMTLRVPVTRARAAGLRKLSSGEQLGKAFVTLKGRAKVARGMWSRRAQEYEAKINSGNIVSIAEVVRDLHKNINQPDRSYSERMIYESALNRLTKEVAAAEMIDDKSATSRVLDVLKAEAA